MRLHRFIGNFDLSAGSLAVIDGELINQWRNVLRLKTGDKLTLSDGEGSEATATILDMDKKEIRLSLEKTETPDREPKKKVTLYCALLKRENFELVSQKATEIGIARIVPLLTERTVKTGFNRERLEKIIKEASEQSGRTTVPKLDGPMKLEQAIAQTDPKETTFFDLGGGNIGPKNSFSSLFIGPEGGWSEKETALAKDAGCTIASLGALTLRGETAAIVASYLLVQN